MLMDEFREKENQSIEQCEQLNQNAADHHAWHLLNRQSTQWKNDGRNEGPVFQREKRYSRIS